MQEVEKKYKDELTAQLREEYRIPVDNPSHPPPPPPVISTIKTEPLDVSSSTPPKKRVASAAEFKDLITPKKTKTSLKNKFSLPKPTSYSKDREEPTFEISNQEYLHSITNVKVDKMKTLHDFLGLKPMKDFTLKLWNGLEKCNCLVDRDSLEGFGQIESDSFFCIMLQYFPDLQSCSDESDI